MQSRYTYHYILESFAGTPLDYALSPLVDGGSRVVCSKPCHGHNTGGFMCYDFMCNPITGYYKALALGNHQELRGTSVFSDIATRRSRLDRSGCDGDAMFAGRFGLGYDTETGIDCPRLSWKNITRVVGLGTLGAIV